MKVKDLEYNWNELGNSDPYWAVLSNPKYVNNKWEKEEFYKTGEQEFKRIFEDFKEEISFPLNRILDFGCGPGRISFQLAKHANNVIGIDISKTMIKLAKQRNVNSEKCKFVVNNKNDLKIIESDHVDLVFSYITLQHIASEMILNYWKEFIRILNKRGKILFNLVSEPPLYYKILYRTIGSKGLNKIRQLKYRKKSVIEMHWINEDRVEKYFENNGCKLLKKTIDKSVGGNWRSYFYLFEKS